jgi:predicted Zn finger-like uncharacterized protein
MKINCESCNTRYAIPDEKVQGAGRTFKITCRKCGAPILVQGIAGEGAPAEAAWYYAVGTERQGPVGTAELARLVHDGVLSGDSYAWCQGMAGWEHLKSIEALNGLLPAEAPKVAAPVHAAPAETPAEHATESEIEAASSAMKTLHELSALTPDTVAAAAHAGPADEEDAGSDTTMIPQEQIAAAHAQYSSESLFGASSNTAAASLFGADDDEEPADEDDAPLFGGLGDDEPEPDAGAALFSMSSAPVSRPRETAAPKASSTGSSLFDSPEVVAGAADDDDIFGSDDFGDDDSRSGAKPSVHGRRETSVLFSLDDIGSSGDQGGTHDDSMVTESSGLIDIRAVAARTSAKSGGVASSPFGDDAASSLVLPGGGGMTLASPIVSRRRGGGFKMAMVAVLAVALGGALVWWLMSQQKPEPAPEARTVAPAAEPAAVAAAPAENPAAEPAQPANAGAGAEGAAAAAGAEGAAAGTDPEAGGEPPAAGAEGAPEGGEVKPEEVPADGAEAPAGEGVAEPAKPKTEPAKPKTEPAKPRAEVAKPEPRPEPIKREAEIPKPVPTAGGSSKDVNDLLKQLNEKKKVEEAEPPSDGAESAGGGLPAKLGASALKGTLRKRHGSFSACYAAQPDRPPGSVTVKTTLVIASSGAVTSARITGGGGTTSAVQSCIVNALLATRFSGFTDPQMIVNYPIVLH